MPAIKFPPSLEIFNHDDAAERQRAISEYYSYDANIFDLVKRLYSGRDITPLYERVLFRPTDGADPFEFEIEIVASGLDAGAGGNILIPAISVKQLVASSLSYFSSTPDTLQRRAEAEIHEISRVTLRIEGPFRDAKIANVTITNNCTPAPNWEIGLTVLEHGECVEYHGSFSAENDGPESLPYADLRERLGGHSVENCWLYDGYPESDPIKHLISDGTTKVVISTDDYVGEGFHPHTDVTQVDVEVHESAPIDFGLFPECRKKAIDRGILPAPIGKKSNATKRWNLVAVEQCVASERFEIHARKPEDGSFLTYSDIYDLSESSTVSQHGTFWLPHFDGHGLYYPIKFGESPHHRPLDSLRYLKKATVQIHSYGTDALYLSGAIAVHDAPKPTALKNLVFGNIPLADIPHEGDSYYRGPTLNVNRLNVAPRKKIQTPNPAFEPFTSDHPLYAFITGGDVGSQLIENTSFGVEQLHLQFRDGRLHLWLVSFERVIPVYHGSLELPSPVGDEKEGNQFYRRSLVGVAVKSGLTNA